MLFCFNRKEVIQISDLQQVIIERADETCNDSISFKLVDGRKIFGISDIQKVKWFFEMIKKLLPQNIAYGGDLPS